MTTERERVMPKITFSSTRFGEIEVDDDKVINIMGGLLGFPESQKYIIIEHETGTPFVWLQSTENSDLAFVIADPAEFFPDYSIQIKRDEVKCMDVTEVADLAIYVICTLRADAPKDMSANLQGPIVVNTKNRIGRQIVLKESSYTTKHYLFPWLRKQ